MAIHNSSWEGPLLTSDVANQLKTALFGARNPQPSYEAETLMAETLRVAVWALNVLKPDLLHTGTKATTRRVLAHARAILEPLRKRSNEHATQQSEQAIGDNVEEANLERDALEALEEQGDEFSLAGRFWLPAPLRLVPIDRTQHLLVGGLPTHLLPPTLLQSMCVHSSFRQVNIDKKESLPTSAYTGTWQFQSLNNWLGPSSPTLDKLIQDFYSRELSLVSEQGSVNLPYEAYAAYVDKPQALRWQSFQEVQDGRYLLRTRTFWGIKQYSIGEVQNYHLARQSDQLRFTDIRRLCYALDHEAKTPTQAIWDRVHHRLILSSEIPTRERKQMAIIGNLRVPQEGYYPREWIGIQSQHASIVDDMLQQLGVLIETSDNR